MTGEPNSCRRLNFENIDEEREVEGDGNTFVESVVEEQNGGKVVENDRNNRFLAGVPDDCIPKIGMEFNTDDEAYKFYLKYAKVAGFGIRKGRLNIDKATGNILDMEYICCVRGERRTDKRDVSHRPETRFRCQAKLTLSSRETGKLRVNQFIAEHVHDLSCPSKTHLFRCHRNITPTAATEIQRGNGVGIPAKFSYALMAKQCGGREHVGFIPDDYKNYLRSKRTSDAKIGDTGGVLEYLHQKHLDDPNFFSAIQVDVDDLVTNIFWSDAKMRADYAHFGDAVCLDTTYKANNEGRPIALFVGVNHHKPS